MEFTDDDHDEDKREAAAADEDARQPANFPLQPHHSGGRKSAAANPAATRYRECLKNHAVSSGGHAVDGCGEFMPAGDAGTLEALTCAACTCHRNFHRKETDTTSFTAAMHPQLPPPPYYRTPPPPPPPGFLYSGPHHLHFRQRPPIPTEEMEAVSNPSSSGGSEGKKRFRTKFTAAQKEKMVAFAEKVGWRIQKHDEAALHQFCEEVQVSRQVLKVWMHNNKHRNPNLSRSS